MNKKERLLCAALLRLAADEFQNHGCNDLDDELFRGWDEDDKLRFAAKVQESQFGDPSLEGSLFMGGDYTLMNYFAEVLEGEA